MQGERKTQKVMDLWAGYHFEVIQRLDKADPTPLRLYKICNGRKQIGKFKYMNEVLSFLLQKFNNGECVKL